MTFETVTMSLKQVRWAVQMPWKVTNPLTTGRKSRHGFERWRITTTTSSRMPFEYSTTLPKLQRSSSIVASSMRRLASMKELYVSDVFDVRSGETDEG